jgi:hypothetical protein
MLPIMTFRLRRGPQTSHISSDQSGGLARRKRVTLQTIRNRLVAEMRGTREHAYGDFSGALHGCGIRLLDRDVHLAHR